VLSLDIVALKLWLPKAPKKTINMYNNTGGEGHKNGHHTRFSPSYNTHQMKGGKWLHG